MFPSLVTPLFRVTVDHNKCIRCRRCIQQCGWGVYRYSEKDNKIIPDEDKCTACGRCMVYCPVDALLVEKHPMALRENSNWQPYHLRNIWKQAESGGVLLTGMGNNLPYPVIWDHLLIDACQVTNPAIDPLREPMELRTYLGRKPDSIEFSKENGRYRLRTIMPPQVKLEAPFIFAPMSYGALSLNAQKSLAIAAKETGIVMGIGEGGLHEDLYPFRDHIIVQVASGRFGVNPDYLNAGVAVEIKIGQGAKPGIGGHLPGEKVSYEISKTRMIPVGTDALSPAPQHDIYSIEDLRQLIYAIKEATEYKKPVSVKIAAVHNVAAIASGIVRAGADIIYIDGFRGGTGASPTVIRDHLGIPIEIALAVVDERLRQEGIRNQVSIIAAGSIRSSADAAKAIALGADAVALGTAALIAMGCHVCMHCHTGNCSWGITTQRPELTQRLDPEVFGQRLANLIRAWSRELKEILGALGINSIESLRGNRERLRGIGLDPQTLNILGVKPAGL